MFPTQSEKEEQTEKCFLSLLSETHDEWYNSSITTSFVTPSWLHKKTH